MSGCGDSWRGGESISEITTDLAKSRHGVVELLVGQIGCRTESQNIGSEIGMHADLSESRIEGLGVRSLQRQEAAQVLQINFAVSADNAGVEIERVESPAQQAYLMFDSPGAGARG